VGHHLCQEGPFIIHIMPLVDQALTSVGKNLDKNPDNRGLKNAQERIELNQERIEKKQKKSKKWSVRRPLIAQRESSVRNRSNVQIIRNIPAILR